MRDFVNWSRTVRATPTGWLRPRGEEELADAIRAASASGQRVKAVGAGHSWSRIAAPEGLAVDLGDLDRIVEIDAAAGTVTVEAGCTLHALLDALARHGLALPIVGSIDAQRLGGIIATGTHGSSLVHGNLASLVRRMELVDGRGERRILEGDDLVAARVHLGALGVVTRLTFGVVPAFRLRETVDVIPFDAGVDQITAWARAEEYVKVWWLPHTDALVRFRYARTDDPGARSAVAWGLDAALSAWVFPPLLRLGGVVPPLIPWVNRAVRAIKFRPSTRVERSDHVMLLPDPPRHRETEMAIPLDRTAEALRWMRDTIARRGARVDFLQEVRFVPVDPAWMSPAHGRDTCQLGAYAAHSPETDGYMAAFREVCEGWGGRPHWGKEMDATPARVRRWYPQAGAFADLARAMDPAGVFRNRFLDDVLG